MTSRSEVEHDVASFRHEAAVAECAYFKAERRGFVPGHELEDWLEAEKEVGGKSAERAGKVVARSKKPEASTAKRAAAKRKKAPAGKARPASDA